MRLPIQNGIEFKNRNFFRSVVHFQINFFKKETRFLFKLNFVLNCHYAIYHRLDALQQLICIGPHLRRVNDLKLPFTISKKFQIRKQKLQTGLTLLPKLRSLILLKNSDKNKTRKRGENFRQIAGKDSNGLNITNFIMSFQKKTTEWISTGEYSRIKTHL